jgi:hypothetical protein
MPNQQLPILERFNAFCVREHITDNGGAAILSLRRRESAMHLQLFHLTIWLILDGPSYRSEEARQQHLLRICPGMSLEEDMQDPLIWQK